MALDFYSAVDLKCGMFRSQEGSVDTASMHARLKQITDLGVPRNVRGIRQDGCRRMASGQIFRP